MTLNQNLVLQGSISVGCVLLAWKLYASVSMATTNRGRSTNVRKKFEQVSSDHHQMSLARGGGSPNEQVWTGLQWSPTDATSRGWVPRSDVQGHGRVEGYPTWPFLWWGGGYPAMWPIPWCIWCFPPHSHEQTVACENITFLQTYLRAANISEVLLHWKAIK